MRIFQSGGGESEATSLSSDGQRSIEYVRGQRALKAYLLEDASQDEFLFTVGFYTLIKPAKRHSLRHHTAAKRPARRTAHSVP